MIIGTALRCWSRGLSVLGSVAGNVLFVVESGSTRTRAAIKALNGLVANGARLIGAALTQAEPEAG